MMKDKAKNIRLRRLAVRIKVDVEEVLIEPSEVLVLSQAHGKSGAFFILIQEISPLLVPFVPTSVIASPSPSPPPSIVLQDVDIL